MKQWVNVLCIQTLLQKQFKRSLVPVHGRFKHYQTTNFTVTDGLTLEAIHFQQNSVTSFARQKLNVSESDLLVKCGKSKNRKFRTYV